MYRRRNQKQVQNDQPVEKKEQPKKEQPVIKYVVQQRGAAVSGLGTVPMLNTLRDINYLNLDQDSEFKSVPFKFIVDVLLSKGYLNADFDFYNKKTEGTVDITAEENNWEAIYTKTTDYKRSTFAPGDLIMFETDVPADASSGKKSNLTIGFLIDKVYTAGSSGAFEKQSELKYTPPPPLDAGETKGSKFNVILSSLTSCEGVVYMFKKDVKLDNVKELCSYVKDQVEGEYNYDDLRKLNPTNMSDYSGADPNYKSVRDEVLNEPRKAGDEGFLPAEGMNPTATGKTDNQFNLSSGAVVDGWIIYMYSSADLSSADVTKANVATITGDVIRAEKVTITTLGNTLLNLGNTFQLPYITTSSTNKKAYYNGNSLKFASEPLNSVQYQKKYGDTVGEKSIDIKSLEIYSLSRCVEGK